MSVIVTGGGYEVGWRACEVAPDDPADLFLRAINLPGDPVNADLRRLDTRASRYDADSVHYHPEEFPPHQTPPKPQPSLLPVGRMGEVVYSESTYSHLRDERVAFVGAGAGSIIIASYFAMRGVPRENMTLIDPSRGYGGIWTQPWARSGGFNNPSALTFSPRNAVSLEDRSGMRILDYLQDMVIDHLGGARRIEECVTDLQRKRDDDRAWMVRTEGRVVEADTVVLGTGTPHPRKIDGRYIRSNLDKYTEGVPAEHLIVERHQRMLSKEELASGRPIVLLGLGNSTAMMLEQIHAFEDRAKTEVDYVVLTHLPFPSVSFPGSRYEGRQSVFRNPAHGYLTGYSGDLIRDRTNYYRALNGNKIVADVTDVHFQPDSQRLRVKSEAGDVTVERPHLFALIGYERDLDLFRAMGALNRGPLRHELNAPDIRPCDGAVRTREDGYVSNVFASGAVAATPRDPNAAVIPGIQAKAVHTMLTLAIRNLARDNVLI